jgi:hypothetical protein
LFLNSKKLMVKKWSKSLYRNDGLHYLNFESSQVSNCLHVSMEIDNEVESLFKYIGPSSLYPKAKPLGISPGMRLLDCMADLRLDF